MNPEANYDVSVDYNILNDAITAIKNIKSKCSQLISDLSGVDVSILDSAGEMAAAIATAEGVMDGPVELVLGRIMEVETLFYMMQNQDFFVDLQEAMQSGKFNDENGNLDIAAVMEHIVMNADGRYQDLLEDEDFRRLFVEQNILSVYGISSMEELENVRNGYLDLTRQYESERNGIVYDAAHMTKAFMNEIFKNGYMFADFDTVAATTIMAYKYTDANGMEVMVDSYMAIPAERRDSAASLSYADLCGNSELYGELKECLNGKASLAAIAFSSGLSDFEAKIDADIEASEVRLAELDNLINGEDGSRTSLMMIDGIVNDVNSRTNHLTNLYGFMINDDFEAMSTDLAGDDVVQAVTDYKNGLFDNFLNFTNNSVDGNDEMNILYSIISGNGEFQTVNGNVVVQKGDLSYFFNSAGDDTLSNYAYWADQMTDDEKACFYYVWNTKGQDAAYDYLQNMSGVLDTRWVLNQREIDSEFASDHKVAASVYSVLANPFEGFSALVYSWQQGINDDNMTRTQVYSHGDTMRQTVSSELTRESEFAGFAYNVGMSMADNMYSMILTGGNSTLSGLVLGVSSYNDSLNDALDRGLTDEQARMFATASAGVEMLMEQISIDKLLKIKPIKGLMDVDVSDVAKLTDTKKGLRNFFGTLDEIDKYTDNVFQNNILSKISGIGNPAARNLAYDAANVIYNGVKQGIGEGNEELLTGVAGRFIDEWIADENSSYNISLQSYINQGYTEAEAMAKVNSEYRDELVTSWLSGAASGTTMGGGQTIRGLVTNDIKINGMLSDYKSNPNYEGQLAELSSNMREGHYDAALTMVVDNGTSYEQGMSDANKLVDSLLNKGMIDEKGKTQLNAYLEADAKAHSVLAGTSYETGNNAVRNNMRAGNYTGGLLTSLVDNGNSQRYDDASKIINNMEQNGIITSDQRDSMLIGVENARNATDMVGHLQKGDAAATLSARNNPTVLEQTVVTENVGPADSDSQVAMPVTNTDTKAKATEGVASDLGVVASSLGLGLTATGTAGLGTTIAALGTETDTSSDSKPKVYSDERIVIEAETQDKYESLGTNKSASREVTQSELVEDSVDTGYELKDGESLGPRIGKQFFAKPKTKIGNIKERLLGENISNKKNFIVNGFKYVVNLFSNTQNVDVGGIHQQIESVISEGGDLTELLNSAPESLLTEFKFTSDIKYTFSEKTPDSLKSNADFIMACVNTDVNSLTEIISYADLSVLSAEQLSSFVSLVNDNGDVYIPNPNLVWDTERNSVVQKYSDNDAIIADVVINSPSNYLNLVIKTVDFCSSDVLIEHISEVLPILKDNHFNLLSYSSNAQILSDAFISDISNYSDYVARAVNSCSKNLLMEHMSEILPILNNSYYSFTSNNENSAIIADNAVANSSICPALAVKLVGDCSENVLVEHMDELLQILNTSNYYLGDYRTNDKVMADKIISDAINDKATLYPNLFVNAVNACSDSLINEHMDELLPILSDCNYNVTFEYGNMRKSFIAESIIKSPIKYPNLVVQAVSCCSENIIIKNIGDILPVLNITGYTFDSFASNNQVIMDAFVADYASYPNLVISFIDSSCLGEVSTDTQLKMLEIAQANGYKLNTKSNFAVLNSLLESMVDLSNFDGKYKDYLSSVIENIGCAPLYFTGYDGLFSYEMIDTFGVDSITEIYKYITLKDVDIDFKLLIDSGKISDFKLLYDDIFKIDVIDSNFDIFSFKNFCNKYLENIQLFDEFLGSDLSLEDKTLLKRFVVEDFGVEVKSLDDLRNYDQLVNAKVSEIINSGNLDSIKDVGSKLLFNMSNEKMGEFLYTYGDSSRISLLSSKVGNSEFLSGAAVLLDFFEKNILNNSDTERVRNIVERLNSMKYEERASISKMFSDIERVIKYYYGEELNGNLTKLSEITSTETVNTREVGKYTGVKHLLDGSESSALVDYVEINSNYRFLQHTLNAYGYGGKITDFLRSRLVGNSYICLSLVGDDKVGVYRDATSINSVSLLFDTIVPQDLLLCGSEDLSSSTKSSNDLEVDVHYSRKDRLRFDISDNILTNTSNDYHNEYTVYRDHIKPSGILVTGIVPNQAEIDAAATLGVSLVRINYKHNSDNSTVVESVIPSLDTDTEIKEFVDYLNDDNSIEISDDDGYELQPGESLGSRIGTQFFANPKASVEISDNIVANDSLSSGDVSDIVAELEIYAEATKQGHGSIVKISSETKDNIAKLNAQQLLEVIKNTDVRYGMRTVMNSANSEQLSIVINDMISNFDSLISNPNFVRALSGNIDSNIYTSLVDSILSNSSGNNRLISTLSDAGIFELFNKYSENSKMLKRLFNNMSASQYTTIYTEYFDNQLSGTIISDLLESSISKDLSNKQLGVIFDGLYGSENLDVIDFANEKSNDIGTDRVNQMISDGTLVYNAELPPFVKNALHKSINKSRDTIFRSFAGEYGVNQNAVGRNVSYNVTRPWVNNLNDFANFIKEANQCSFATAYTQAVLCNTPFVPISAGDRTLIIRYLAVNSESYGIKNVMEYERDILKRTAKTEYRQLLNNYILKGVDLQIASMILDSIDATGACSYAAFANLIVDSYKNNPEGFKKDFGFDLYVEVNGKTQINSQELMADMFIFMNSVENGGRLFRNINGSLTLVDGYINTNEQVYVSGKGKFNPCVHKYLESKNVNLKLNSSGVINAANMSKNSLKNAVAQALQSGKQLDMYIGRNLSKPVNFHGPLGIITESTLTWSEGGAHVVYVTGITDNAIIVSSWGNRYTIPFSNLVENPNVSFIVTQLENMSTVSETLVDGYTTVLSTDVNSEVLTTETVDVPVISEVSNSISIDTSNLDAKGVADLLNSLDFDDNYDANINQIFKALSEEKFVDVVKYMNENSMFDCDMIGALDQKLMVSKLEILYDKSPELISPFIETIPGMMGSIIEEIFTNSNNIDYGLIETILNSYDNSNILTIVNDSPSLKNSLDMLPEIKETYISEQQNTLTSYRINETRLSVNLFTMDIIDTIVNSNSSIDITNLLNDITFSNDALTILLDKLAKSGKINIKNSIISSLDSGRLFEIINNSIKNGYKLTSVIDSLSTEQFVSFVEQLSDDSVKSFLEQVSLEKIVSVYADLGLSGRYKLDSKFGNFVDMLNLSIYSQKVNDGSMRDYVIQLSDSEFNEFIDEILRNEVVGVTDLVETIIGYDSDRISNMIENGTLEFNDKLPESIKRSIMEKVNVRERAFESTADGTIDIRGGITDFGIDQDITRKHVKFTVKNNSWMKSLDHFAEFIIEDAKRNSYADNMTKERALEFAKELSTPGTIIRFGRYDIITRYLANNYLVKDVLKYSRDSFIRENSSEYKRVLDKITPYCKDVVTATKILDCINSTGVCSYAAVANVIFDYYKDIPDQFRKDFGFDLYIEIDGQKRINEIELLTDMYITINSDQMNGKLFRHGGFFGRGKLQTMSNLDTRFQVYMSNSSIGVDLDIFNKYLGLKNKNLAFTKNEMAFDATHTISSTEIKKMFVDGLRSGNYINLGISKTDKKIRFNNPDGSTYNSTFDWNEGGGHAVYVVGVTDNSVVVSSWGKKLLIPFEDLVDNKFRVSFLSKTDATTSPVTIPNVEVTQQNSDSVVNYTVSVDGSSYSVSSNNSFKDKLLEKYYDSVLKKISNKVNNSDLGYGTVSRMIEKSMGDYFKKLTSGSKIYEIMSSLNNKQMLFYAVNNFDLSLLSNEQLQGIINRAVKNGYVLNSYSSQFVKSNSNIIMRLLQPDSYYFRKNAGNSDSTILKNRQRQEAFIEFVNSINYSALNSEQISEIIDIAVKNEYYISEKSPNFIRGNIDIISKVMDNLNEKFQYNQTLNSIDYSTLSDADLLVLADCVGKSRFGISEFIPSSLRFNFEFIMQVVNSSADGSINSKLSGVDYSNFSDQQLLDLMRVAVNKGYVLDVHSPIERLNVVLENDVKTYLETISPDYKELLIPIIDRLGYSSVGIEGYNGIFSQDMLSRFGVDFVTDMYKYCNLTGSKVNFELLISNGQIDTFKQIFDSVLGSKYNGTLSDIKLVKKIFDKCINNSKLFEDILSSDINDDVISNLRKYVNSNFRIEVNSVDELMQYDSLVKSYVDGVIASGDINRVKDTISLLLFNASDGDMYDFNQTFDGSKKIDILAKKIGNSELSSVLRGYSVLLKFYQSKVASNNNSKALISICKKLNNMSYDDRISYLKVFDDIDGFVRYCYGMEVNESLTKLDSIIGRDAKNIRVDGKYTWQDGNEFVSVDYVEINSNYRLFQHTLNAFGEGGKLSDYQSGRVVGKSYLCLSMIGDNKIGVIRETSDVDHVTLLFDSLVSEDLMACAPRDIGSGYRTENNELFINNRGSRFDIVDNILSDTSSDSYNEYVIYRNNAKPAGILVTGVEANNSEIEAAARLGVPLVKINYSGNEKISSNNVEVSTEFSESMDEFVGYLTGKNTYTVTKNSPRGQIIYDANNSQIAIDVVQGGKSSFGNSQLENRVLSSMDSMVDEKAQFVQSKVELSNEQNLLVQGIVDSINGANELSTEIKNRISMLDSQSAVGLLDYYFNVRHDLVLTKKILNSFTNLPVILESFVNDSNAKDLVPLVTRSLGNINISNLINHFDSLGMLDKFINLLSNEQLKHYFNAKNDRANYILSKINSESLDTLIERGLLTSYFNLFDNDEMASGPFKNCSLKITASGDGAKSDYVLLTSKSIQAISEFMNSLNTDSGNIDFSIETLESIKKFDVKTVTTLLDILSQNNEYSSVFSSVIQNLNDNILVDFVEKNIGLPNFDMVLSSFNLEQLSYIFKNSSNNKLLLDLCSKYSSTDLLNFINTLNDSILTERILSLVDVKYVSEINEMINDGSVDSYIEGLSDLLLGEKIIHLFNQHLNDNIAILEKFIEHIDLNRLNNMVENGTLKYCSTLSKDIKKQIINKLSSQIDGEFSKLSIPNHYGCNQSSVRDSVKFTVKTEWVSDIELLTDIVLKFSPEYSREEAFKVALSMNTPGNVIRHSGYKIAISYLEAVGLNDLEIMSFMRNNFSANPLFKNLLDKYVSQGSDTKTVIEILNCIDTTGVCTYAKVANIIFNTFKDMPNEFKKIFGFDLFVEQDGKLGFNDTELLADMYIRINSVELGGKLFTYQNGKVDIISDSIDTSVQIQLSNDSRGINAEIVNKYLELLGARIRLVTSSYVHVNGVSKASTEDIRHKVIMALQNGMNVSLDVRPGFDSKIDFYSNSKTIMKKLTNPSEGHAVYLTGLLPMHLCVSTWGRKGYLYLPQLLESDFCLDFSRIVDIGEMANLESSEINVPTTMSESLQNVDEMISREVYQRELVENSSDDYVLDEGESLGKRIGIQFFAEPKTNSGTVVDGLNIDTTFQEANGNIEDAIIRDEVTGNVSVDITSPKNILVEGNNLVVRLCSNIENLKNRIIYHRKLKNVSAGLNLLVNRKYGVYSTEVLKILKEIPGNCFELLPFDVIENLCKKIYDLDNMPSSIRELILNKSNDEQFILENLNHLIDSNVILLSDTVKKMYSLMKTMSVYQLPKAMPSNLANYIICNPESSTTLIRYAVDYCTEDVVDKNIDFILEKLETFDGIEWYKFSEKSSPKLVEKVINEQRKSVLDALYYCTPEMLTDDNMEKLLPILKKDRYVFNVKTAGTSRLADYVISTFDEKVSTDIETARLVCSAIDCCTPEMLTDDNMEKLLPVLNKYYKVTEKTLPELANFIVNNTDSSITLFDMAVCYCNLNSDLLNLLAKSNSEITNIINNSILTDEYINSVWLAIVRKYNFNSYTPSYLIMYVIKNSEDLNLISRVINFTELNSIPNEYSLEILEIARQKGYHLTTDSPHTKLNLLVESSVLLEIKSFDYYYNNMLSIIIDRVGYAALYFEGYNGIFSREVIDTFGVDIVCEIYKYLNLLDVRIDFEKLVSTGKLSSFKSIYNVLFGSNFYFGGFDIRVFKQFAEKYLQNTDLFHVIMENELSTDSIRLLRRFITESFDIKVNSYEDLQKYELLVKEYVLQIINTDDLVKIQNVVSQLIFNINPANMYNFRSLFEKKKIELLATKIDDSVESSILSGYSVLLDFLEKIDNMNLEQMKNIAKKLNEMTYEDRSLILEKSGDIKRFIKYCYGLELNKSLTKIDDLILTSNKNIRETKKYKGSKYLLNGDFESDVFVDYIEISSNYCFLMHTMNLVHNYGRILDYLKPRLVGSSHLCLTLIGNGNIGKARRRNSYDINHVTLLFDRIIPQNLLCASYKDAGSGDPYSNALFVAADTSFDITDNNLKYDDNEYVVLRDKMYPSGIYVTGYVPNQAEIDAAATLGVPLVKINYQHVTTAATRVTFNSSQIASELGGQIKDFVGYLNGESDYFVTRKSAVGIISASDLVSSSESKDNVAGEDIAIVNNTVSVDSSRKNIIGISKNSMLEMKLANANSRTIDGMIRDGKLNEYLNSLSFSEIYDGPLAKHVYQFANKMDLDAMGDSFVLLTSDQFDNIDDFMDSIDDDLSQGLVLSQESVDMMDAMSSEEIVVVLDKLLDNSEYFESAKQVVKYIDDSVLGQVFDRVMIRDDSLAITSYLDADQVVSLMDYYSEDSVSYDKFCRNVSYAKFTKVAKVLNEMSARGDLNAARMRSKLDRNIDARFVSDIRSKNKNGTLSTYLSSMSNSDLGRLFEKMINQKVSDSSKLCDSMIEMIGPNKFNILVRNGYIKFDTRFSKETQRAILDIINQQKDGSLKELSVYGVDQGYIRSHIRYGVKTNWSDNVTDIASFLTKNYGLDVFEADGKALSLTSPGYVMDYEEHKMMIGYLSSKYGTKEATRMSEKLFTRKVDSRYVAALNKLVSHDTDIKIAQAILDCIDTTGVCSYASVANLIVDAYKDNPSQFKIDFGFDLYTYENGRKEINSTELLADMYVYINSNLCGGKLFTIKDGKVTTNSSVIDTTKQIYLSSNHGFETSIVNKYLHSKNPNVTINVTSASQFYADGVNSEVDNIKTAIVRAMQEGKQVTLGVYRTKGSQYSFLDERGVKKESTVDWSEGDGHAVYVTGVTDNGVVVSTWGKRRVIPFADFIDNMYSINFVEIGIDGSVSANNQRKVPIYSNPTLAINDGRGSVMDGASLTSGLSDSDKHRIFKEAKRAYFKSQLGSDILKYNQIYLQKGLRVKAGELNIDRRVNKNKKLKLDANAMIAARNKLSDSEAIKLGKKQFDIEADAYAQAVLDKAIETANSHVKNVSEESVDITEENVQTQTAADTTDQTTDVDNNNDNKENVNTDSNVDNNNSVNTNIVNKQIKLSKMQKAKIIRDAKKGYIKEQLNGVNKDEFYRNRGYEVKAKEIQFNTVKKKTDKINKNALKAAKNLLTDSEAIKLGKETLEAQALEYAEKRVEDILAGKLEYKSKGSPIKKLAVTSVGAIVLLSYLGSIGDIPLGNDLLGDDILGNDDVDDVEPSDDEDSSDDGGNGPTNPEGGSPGNPDVGGSDDVPEITDSNVMEPNEDVASTIPQDIPVIENVIEEVANGTNYSVKTDYVTDGIVEIPNVGEENLNQEILDGELINSDEPYLIPMSSDYVDMSDKKDVTGKGLVLGGMGLATLGALGTKLYLDKKKEDEEFEEDEFAEELEQEDNQDVIELIDNNDEEVDSDYEVPIFYSDTLKDEE